MGSSPGLAAPAGAQSSKRSFIEFITQPTVDRIVAIIACVPFVWLTYYRYTHWPLGIPLLAFSAGILVLLATMIFRRAPTRLTPNPWFWALAFFATYWPMLTLTFMQPGSPVAAASVTDSLAVVGLGVIVWARLSLGRNIGFVPAQREIVTTGAYRYLRHPIYFGLFITFFGVALRAFSARNLALISVHAVLLMVKSVVEERFLAADPQYAAYLQKVRKRWIPFVL
ncbi:MAG: phosphatidylethanolamine N-methyltransferase family protein [Acidobacteriales bacterium]|nr:phosphatidylethanolamine N-methyltransferase family protein [Terriglobales bacterium]